MVIPTSANSNENSSDDTVAGDQNRHMINSNNLESVPNEVNVLNFMPKFVYLNCKNKFGLFFFFFH